MFELSQTPSTVAVTFVTRDGGPSRLLADAELHFLGGVLDGVKLVGFTLWQSPEGQRYVTVPSRSWGAGGERRFYDLLRLAEGGDAQALAGLKTEILRAYESYVTDQHAEA